MNAETNVFFVVNPHAANNRTGKLWGSLKTGLKKIFSKIDFEFTRHSMHAQTMTTRALESGYDTIVAVGGDGTVNEVLNGFYDDGRLIRRDAVLAYLPSGTGADLARSLGTGASGILSHLKQGRKKRLDHGLATFQTAGQALNTRYFINEASVGFSADTASAVNRSNKRLGGKASFIIGVMKCLVELKNPLMEISVDGRIWHRGNVLTAVVANGKFFAGSMKVAPHALLDDGKFDVVLIREMSRREVVRHIGKIYQGRHLSLPQVSTVQGESVVIESSVPVLLEMDGEQTGMLLATFNIVKKGINFLIPHFPSGV